LLSELSNVDWLLLAIGSVGVGLSKSGLAGIGMVHVILFAHVFGAFRSTGVLLPLLIVGDILAVRRYGSHVQWSLVKRLFPPAIAGVVCGWALMGRLDDDMIEFLIGIIILMLTIMQTARMWKPDMFGKTSHSIALAYAAGVITGFTTMIANAAGPIISLYLLAISTPKLQLIGTSSWFFLFLNSCKVPFSYQLGLIGLSTLTVNLVLVPAVVLGMTIGSKIVHYIPQNLFNVLILIFTTVAACRLMHLF
jgi:uncharacterized membrane protein YfcA